MRLTRLVLGTLLTILLLATAVSASSVYLYADTAPNKYGSPNWASWWATAKSDVVAGTFTNMRSGTYPGTNLFLPQDELVYSFGDLGHRLHWIYWIPDTTINSLRTNFEVKLAIDWGGDDYALDWSTNGWLTDGPNAGWTEPGSWEEYNGGVIGSLGLAFWPSTPAEIVSLTGEINSYQTFARGTVRLENSNGDWETESVQLQNATAAVPEPASVVLAILGLAPIAGFAKLRRK
ncbi:MAG: PEP-CTERM sorting domain-containing protein [Armatimonadota bacterium]